MPHRRLSLKRQPAGCCSYCRRACQRLFEVGSRCYHCNIGIFMHRCYWDFVDCSHCGGTDAACASCHGAAVVALAPPVLART